MSAGLAQWRERSLLLGGSFYEAARLALLNSLSKITQHKKQNDKFLSAATACRVDGPPGGAAPLSMQDEQSAVLVLDEIQKIPAWPSLARRCRMTIQRSPAQQPLKDQQLDSFKRDFSTPGGHAR